MTARRVVAIRDSVGDGSDKRPWGRADRFPSGAYGWLRWASVAALVGYVLFAILPACLHPDTNGYAAYYTASRVLLTDHAELYRVYDRPWFQARIDAFGFVGVRDIHNTQPPTVSLILAALAWLSPSRARMVWVLASGAMVTGSRSRELVAGLSVAANRELGRWSLVACGAATLYSPLRDNFRHGQCYTLLLLCLCLVFRMELRTTARTSFAAGVPLGVMAPPEDDRPLAMAPPSTRRSVADDRPAASGTALLVALAAGPVIGVAPWRAYFDELPRLSTDPSRYVTAYQTVTSMMGHLFCFDARWSRGPVVDAPVVARWSTGMVMAASLAVSALVQRMNAAGTLGACPLPGDVRLAQRDDGAGRRELPLRPRPSVARSRHRVGRGAGSRAMDGRLLRCGHCASRDASALPDVAVSRGGVGSPSWRHPRVYGALLLWAWLCVALLRMRAPPADPGA